MMLPSIAIVGMSCRYADAQSPEELWENVLSQRRSFRRIPPERLRLEDYFSPDRTTPDAIYSTQAALIEGFDFDRVHFKVAGSTFRSADMAHWLALDVAAKAVESAGFINERSLPKENTGVFLGNTLTGEFSRANSLRLRFPYVRRVVEAVLRDEFVSAEQIPEILGKIEKSYKEPFPQIGEESLAGGLSNTIAGRICNFFDFKGGGYTVDGACSSSLLAVFNACSALFAGDVDLALAGGIDLSIDPFELVGFAKTGALAAEEMRVYDAKSNGFFPGEGCGFVLLMREEDALRQGLDIYATIKGWGISSDGSGGITRPEIEGQKLALQRAYRRAGFGIETIAYFEGHGTGTAVGDTTELKALSQLRQQVSAEVEPAVISSIKTLIGHTKAAAGIAGLIKATLALRHEILPPTTGCETPHPELCKEPAALKVLPDAELWNENLPLRAGVSSMGFGGINTHVVLERKRESSRVRLSQKEKTLLSSKQDTELFLLSASTSGELLEKTEQLLTIAPRLSLAELGDLAVRLARNLQNSVCRAAVIASNPAQLEARLKQLREKIASGETNVLNVENGVFYGSRNKPPRIGFLFSGQGSPSNLNGGLWFKRFESVRDLYDKVDLSYSGDSNHTQIAQIAIVTASMAALKVLDKFDITACIGVGHSLGELTALHWAGVFDEQTLLRIARVRGRAMTETCLTKGAMLSVSAEKERVEALLSEQEKVVIAGLNAPKQTVVSGEAESIDEVQRNLRDLNIASVKLPVSHAFHSPLVAKSAEILGEYLAQEAFQKLNGTIFSTVTGQRLSPQEDLRDLLYRQITQPVRFTEAIENAEKSSIDLWIEVGTGKILSGLLDQNSQTPAIALEASGESLSGLFQAVGAAFVLGQTINQEALYSGRFTKQFDLDWKPKFFLNPCELAPLPAGNVSSISIAAKADETVEPIKAETETIDAGSLSPLEIVIKLVAERAELPSSAVKEDSRMLSDLHLNSITVGQLVSSAAKLIGAPAPLSPTDFADGSISEIAAALETLKNARDSGEFETEEFAFPAGVDVWVKPFCIELSKKNLIARRQKIEASLWKIFAPEDTVLSEQIRQAFSEFSGSGVVVLLPPEVKETDLSILLEAGKCAAQLSEGKFIMLQTGKSCSAFARSFALEHPRISTCVINLKSVDEKAVEVILNESAAAEGFVEVFYDANGERFEPIARPVTLTNDSDDFRLTENDVLVVTGGAKGITAECVLALARKTKVRLALLGTSLLENDTELRANLERFQTLDSPVIYLPVDVTDAQAVRGAIGEIEEKLGEVTGLLHAAGRNHPTLITKLNYEKLEQTFAVKVKGARNLLEAVEPGKLKLFLTFGSIIARSGLPGESDYGLANEWLRQLTEEFQVQNPRCRCLSIEWSVWESVGMGAKIADLDALKRQGIIPIPIEKGVRAFLQLLSQEKLPTSVVVMSRFRDLPMLRVERGELPFWRFLEQPRVYYPKTELLVDVDLSTSNDLYLDEHQVEGEKLLPAVVGLEAMVQAASALFETEKIPVLEQVRFLRPVLVQADKPTKIRLAALALDDQRVEVSLQSSTTSFQTEHFHAICNFSESEKVTHNVQPFVLNGQAEAHVEIEPLQDLYGKILFHEGRFRRLTGYKLLQKRECLAEIAASDEVNWFSPFLPKQLLLGDPARRDAAIHAVQACIPHVTLLPVSVDSINIFARSAEASSLVYAREKGQTGDIFNYDLQILDAQGQILEIWEGLRLQKVNGTGFNGEWCDPLLSIYLERNIEELFDNTDVSISINRDSKSERRERSRAALRNILGGEFEIRYRNDGKPEIDGEKFVSVSHLENLTLGVVANKSIGCDIEAVKENSLNNWQDLIGQNGFELAQSIADSTGEDFNTSAARIWTVREALRKVGVTDGSLLMISSFEKRDWVVLTAGNYQICSSVVYLRNSADKTACAFCTEK